MTAKSAHTIEPRLSPEEIRNSTAISLAADTLDRAMEMLPADLHITLIQVTDSGLLSSDPMLEKQARDLSYQTEKLTSRLHAAYPHCMHGGASALFKGEGRTLDQQVSLYREEQFWTQRGRENYLKSELLIADIYRIYGRVSTLRDTLDAENEGNQVRRPAPRCQPNPYEHFC